MAQYESLELQLRAALQRCHTTLTTADVLSECRPGSGGWNAWMLERDKTLVQARHALIAALEAQTPMAVATPAAAREEGQTFDYPCVECGVRPQTEESGMCSFCEGGMDRQNKA